MINKNLIIERLKELSDASWQEQLWTGKILGQQSSFVEAVCGLFDDAGLARALESGRLATSYSAELCRLTNKLSELVALIADGDDPSFVLKHTKMPAIRLTSAALLTTFLLSVENNAGHAVRQEKLAKP